MSRIPRSRLVLAWMVLLLACPGFARAQAPDPFPPYADRHGASVRFLVTPKEAQVYVDGFYTGIVDDYDGAFQKLTLPPGEHEVVLYLAGYRTVHQTVNLTPRDTFKLRYKMEKLAPGEMAAAPPVAPSPQAQAGPASQPPQPPQGPFDRRPGGPQGPRFPGGRRGAPPPARGSAPSGAFGTLSIRVQPAGAEVLIDGERWQGPDGEERLLVQVAEGPHHVEFRREGYRGFSSDVTVRIGDTVPLNVSLSPDRR